MMISYLDIRLIFGLVPISVILIYKNCLVFKDFGSVSIISVQVFNSYFLLKPIQNNDNTLFPTKFSISVTADQDSTFSYLFLYISNIKIHKICSHHHNNLKKKNSVFMELAILQLIWSATSYISKRSHYVSTRANLLKDLW